MTLLVSPSRRYYLFSSQVSKQAGFTTVMADLPWEWTEQEQEGEINLQSFGKDWLKIAYHELNMKLHIVVTMRETPYWVERDVFF
jgi:hypothetical protein